MTTSAQQRRQPPGRPAGGEYAPTVHAEPSVALAANPADAAALRQLESLRDTVKDPAAKKVVGQLIENPHRAALALLKAAALLGSNEEWDSGMLNGIKEDCDAAGLPSVGDQDEEALRGYRELAERFGFEHDGPEDEDDTCPECGEPVDDGEGYDGYCGTCADRLEAAGHWG